MQCMLVFWRLLLTIPLFLSTTVPVTSTMLLNPFIVAIITASLNPDFSYKLIMNSNNNGWLSIRFHCSLLFHDVATMSSTFCNIHFIYNDIGHVCSKCISEKAAVCLDHSFRAFYCTHLNILDIDSQLSATDYSDCLATMKKCKLVMKSVRLSCLSCYFSS
jgi:hypothetical protein